MPRPKVPLQNRKRAVQACTHCRNSKKRCNGQQPCANCVRKGIENSCVFEDIAPTPPTQATSSTSRPQPGISETSGRSPASGSVAYGLTHVTRSPAVTAGTIASTPDASHRTHARLLDTSHGEKVFFGGSASLAFLQFIRDTVSQSLGRSNFSHNAAQNHMLEDSRANALPVSDIPLAPQQEHTFLDAFLVAARGIVVTREKNQVLDILNSYRAGNVDIKPLEIAIAQTMLAIGAQCSTLNHANITIGRSYFVEAQRQAFAEMIEDPNLEMVELFLLMSFYMLGAAHRNAAFMYIGVAGRAAHALGLHYASPENRQTVSRDRQYRCKIVWQCLVILDTIISAVLGRPSAASAPPSKFRKDWAADLDPKAEKNTAMQANYELACLLDLKVQELYNSDKVTVEAVRECLDELSAWSSRLPAEVRHVSHAIQAVNAQEQVVSGLHVSCFYYFAVMLVSRPFLIVHLTNRLAKSKIGSQAGALEPSELDIEAEIQEIASACLNAATYMVQTTLETQSYGFLPDNMRLLKAWVFAAGLVLGFEMFTTTQSESEIEDAFRGSCSILKVLSLHSILAAQYFDILTSLSDAITARRRQALTERKRIGRPIVERIMAFEAPDQPQESSSSATRSDAMSTTGTAAPVNEGLTADNWFSGITSDFDFQELMNEPFLNWDSTDFLSWDPFTRDPPA